jgi:hypothetical protein
MSAENLGMNAKSPMISMPSVPSFDKLGWL